MSTVVWTIYFKSTCRSVAATGYWLLCYEVSVDILWILNSKLWIRDPGFVADDDKERSSASSLHRWVGIANWLRNTSRGMTMRVWLLMQTNQIGRQRIFIVERSSASDGWYTEVVQRVKLFTMTEQGMLATHPLLYCPAKRFGRGYCVLLSQLEISSCYRSVYLSDLR